MDALRVSREVATLYEIETPTTNIATTSYVERVLDPVHQQNFPDRHRKWSCIKSPSADTDINVMHDSLMAAINLLVGPCRPKKKSATSCAILSDFLTHLLQTTRRELLLSSCCRGNAVTLSTRRRPGLRPKRTGSLPFMIQPWLMSQFTGNLVSTKAAPMLQQIRAKSKAN